MRIHFVLGPVVLMNRLPLLVVLIWLHTLPVKAELKPFTSDGCSVFPDGTTDQQSLWLNCCIEHDLAYWKGGTEQERLDADKRLGQCVSEVGEPEIASLMLAGVRVGGSPYFPTWYRWGYGWPYPRGYQTLTEPEKQEIRLSLEKLEMMMSSLLRQLKSELR